MHASRFHSRFAIALTCIALWVGAAGAGPEDILPLKAVAQRAADRGEQGAREFLRMIDWTADEAAIRMGNDWLLRTARAGVPEAQFQVGLSLAHTGKRAEAVGWYEKAAQQGFTMAENNLAAAYANGEGVKRDEAKAIEWSLKAAAKGSATSQARLGSLYFESDPAKSVYWLEKSAAQGHPPAMSMLGGMYLYGKGATADYEKARYWLRKAVAAGEDDAKPLLASAERMAGGAARAPTQAGDAAPAPSHSTPGVSDPLTPVREIAARRAAGGDEGARHFLAVFVNHSKDRTDGVEALRWLERLGDEDANAAVFLALMYEQMKTPQVDKAVAWLEKAARMGSALAQDNLAARYMQGSGVPKDRAKAIEWSRKAAEQGSHASQARLGAMYLTGDGTPKDVNAAVQWLEKAAQGGVVTAQALLGMLYAGDEGVTRDPEKARYWLRKAADQGDKTARERLERLDARATASPTMDLAERRKLAESGDAQAQYRLGMAYYSGIDGATKDQAQAALWLRKAADQGHPRAQYALGYMYMFGLGGLPKDLPAAAKLLQLSADQNIPEAMSYLGQFHEKGLGGVAKDAAAARALYLRASQLGNQSAKERLKKMDATTK